MAGVAADVRVCTAETLNALESCVDLIDELNHLSRDLLLRLGLGGPVAGYVTG
jgi:hypothetical protein